MRPKRNAGRTGVSARERVPLAQIKLNFSRYVREVQVDGRSIIITQHGRDSAVLAPLPSAPPRILRLRQPIDPRPLGALKLRPPQGEGAGTESIARALNEERGE